MTLINVNAGLDFAYDATALSQFSDLQLWAPPGSVDPRLSAADPISVVIDASPQNNPYAYITTWGPAVDDASMPVSAVLMHDAIYNEFVLDAATKSGTDWVVTMPTKTYYYTGASDKELKVTKLFQRNFKSTGACDDVTIIKYDREERTVKTPGSFSPPPADDQGLDLLGSERHHLQQLERAGLEERREPHDDLRERLDLDGVPGVLSSVGPIPYSSNAHQLGGSLTTADQPDHRRVERLRLRPRTTACR